MNVNLFYIIHFMSVPHEKDRQVLLINSIFPE
jgi:hypothetical protein